MGQSPSSPLLPSLLLSPQMETLVAFSFSCKEKYNLCQLPNYYRHTPFTLTVPIQSSYLTLVGCLSKRGSKMFLAVKCIQFRKALDNLKGLKLLRFDPWVKPETLAGKWNQDWYRERVARFGSALNARLLSNLQLWTRGNCLPDNKSLFYACGA